MDQIQKIGHFEKVSFEQYYNALIANGHIICNPEQYPDLSEKLKAEAYDEWQKIQLPERATSGSAGYDFYLPHNTAFSAGDAIVVPTGIRVSIEPGWFLMILPRSGLGFKYGMKLENTAGVIDSDYYFANNEGHIMAKIDTKKNFYLDGGDRFAQGIFLPYGITIDDRPIKTTRHGGFGSTGN